MPLFVFLADPDKESMQYSVIAIVPVQLDQ